MVSLSDEIKVGNRLVKPQPIPIIPTSLEEIQKLNNTASKSSLFIPNLKLLMYHKPKRLLATSIDAKRRLCLASVDELSGLKAIGRLDFLAEGITQGTS